MSEGEQALMRASRIIASQLKPIASPVLRISFTIVDFCLIIISVMETQTPIDYWKMFVDLMERRAKLIRQRDEAEIELAKMKQLIVSVFALLREDQQKANQQAIDDMEAESAGLQDQIKLVFSEHPGVWMTVSDVRDHASDMGFDFRQYKANPLASIKTTLKRLADSGYVHTDIPGIDGTGTLYMRDAPLQRLRMLKDLLTPVMEERKVPQAPRPPNWKGGLPAPRKK